MKLDINEAQGTTIISLTGSLDANTCSEVDTSIMAAITKTQKVIINLSALEYISSAGLRLLLGLAKQMQKQSGKLLLASPSKQVQSILDISGFAAIFSIHQTLDDAQKAINL